ncbi:MAG: alpha-amylase [Alphaproteobacteria bacterium]|nr:alpha-amylase [Alphaproteobacteria bacterium]MDE2113117.1 alpha-amylase [Alphaproteobacteria bacterium]MDE2493726.1 alpha-amylase [Alphaproteobacteria bacterium]
MNWDNRVAAALRNFSVAALLCFGGLGAAAAQDATPAPTVVHHPAWAVKADIYEVNVRQYSKQGTFAGVDRQLPRLGKMGVDILWLMPINPIGKENRKGTLGSYYSVADYLAVNPEFGTLDDFKHLVNHAHALGMKVIIDWVANHTAWDNVWVKEHPDWYLKDADGKIGPVRLGTGPDAQVWSDVVGLDYRQPALRAAMIDAMTWWVRNTDIDGFRCDFASNVPTDFWVAARTALEKIKPVFMLAEADKPELDEQAFDMTYDWDLYHLMVKIAHGQGDARDLAVLFLKPPKVYPAGAYQMLFTSDHDENSWNGSDPELYGKGFQVYAVLAATLPGMPLVYGGQEAGLDKRLAFFERDPIDWDRYKLAGFYRRLLSLKHRDKALWNGSAGGDLKILDPHNKEVFAFVRVKGRNRVTVDVNVSGAPQAVKGDGLKTETLAPYAYRIAVQ